MPRTSLGTFLSKNSCQGRLLAHSCRKIHAKDEFGHNPVEKFMPRTSLGTILSKNSCQGRVLAQSCRKNYCQGRVLAHSCSKIHADWQAGRFQSGCNTVFWRKRFSQSGFGSGFGFYSLPVAYGHASAGSVYMSALEPLSPNGYRPVSYTHLTLPTIA